MAPGARCKFGAPFSNLRSSGSKYTVSKKVRVTLLEIFGAPAIIRRPYSISAPPELFGTRVIAPSSPSLRPC